MSNASHRVVCELGLILVGVKILRISNKNFWKKKKLINDHELGHVIRNLHRQ